jgi:cytoskeletal protein RodZ
MPFSLMKNLQYNFALLKKTREDKEMSKLEMAHQLCLSVNQIDSIEENSFRYFPSESIKFAAVKKYVLALNLDLDQVIKKKTRWLRLMPPQQFLHYSQKKKIRLKKALTETKPMN